MKTGDMQRTIAAAGDAMRREEYAGTSRHGRLVSRHRWAVHNLSGSLVCRGRTPGQCFKRWKAQREDRAAMDAIRFMTAEQLEHARKGKDRFAQLAREYNPEASR